MLRWLLAAVHLLALGIGLGSVWARARLLGAPTLDGPTLRRALAADAWWGVAALLWVSSGLWRLLASTEKPTAYYVGNHVFWTKMALFGAILVLESRPIVTAFAIGPLTIVRQGVRAGERVVTDGQMRLVSGARVDVKASGPMSPAPTTPAPATTSPAPATK